MSDSAAAAEKVWQAWYWTDGWERPRRLAADRRAQKRRKAGRIIQEVVKDLNALRQHRGCQPSRLGQALLNACRECTDNKRAPGTWFVIPRPEQVPHTRLQTARDDGKDIRTTDAASSGSAEYEDAASSDEDRKERQEGKYLRTKGYMPRVLTDEVSKNTSRGRVR